MILNEHSWTSLCTLVYFFRLLEVELMINYVHFKFNKHCQIALKDCKLVLTA